MLLSCQFFRLHPHLHEDQLLSGQDKLLILNDAFGALAVALANYSAYSWNDSLLSQQALHANLIANGHPRDEVKTNTGIDFPTAAVDVVLIKIPQSLALLEHQLYALRPILHQGSKIFAAGMSRHIHSSTLELFEKIVNDCHHYDDICLTSWRCPPNPARTLGTSRTSTSGNSASA